VRLEEAQYLGTAFPDLDQEYKDGELVERSQPDNLHSRTQVALILIFATALPDADRFLRTELRLRLRSGLYRIPDLCVFHPQEPHESIPEFAPLVAIEILSPDDRLSEARAKLEEYRTLGIPHVWLVDPYGKRLYALNGGFTEVVALRVPELRLEISPLDIFTA
jgi:Uma2 family endonuclease